VQLVAAHALLGRAKEVDRLQPDVKRNLGTLENRPHGHGKGLAAVLALVEAITGRFTFKSVMGLANAATMRADRPIRPADGLKVFAGFLGALEMGLVQVGTHS
jgi:hypothetical protein